MQGTIFRAIVASGALALAACGTPTPYQPATDGEGYSEQALEGDRYRVTFAGNSLTARETVENYLLYRAADVTLARGFDHFVVVEKDTERNTTYFWTGTGFGPYGFWPYRGFYRGTAYPFVGAAPSTAWPSDSYAAYANIVMRSGPKPADDPNAYDARAVIERIGPSIARGPSS